MYKYRFFSDFFHHMYAIYFHFITLSTNNNNNSSVNIYLQFFDTQQWLLKRKPVKYLLYRYVPNSEKNKTMHV